MSAKKTAAWAGLPLAAMVGVLGVLILFIAAVASGAAGHEDDDQQQVACTAGLGRSKDWSKEQLANAATITAVARHRHLPARAAVIAVATALQESGLRNLDRGDRDSLGLFQQRPSQGWGDARQVRDPARAAGTFYDHLVRIRGWRTMPLTKAAQTVQSSAFPGAYARHEADAAALVRTSWGQGASSGTAQAGCTGPHKADGQQADTQARKVIAAARSQTGTPYVWGGGNQHGPTRGGFDCSGLMQYAFHQGAHRALPRTSQGQRHAGTHVAARRAQPGDLVVINNDGDWGHVGLYLGKGRMLHAPHTGATVTETRLDDGYWKRFAWDVRRVL